MEFKADEKLRKVIQELLVMQATKAEAEPDEVKSRAIMVLSALDIITGGASLVGAVLGTWAEKDQQEVRDQMIKALDKGLSWGKETQNGL